MIMSECEYIFTKLLLKNRLHILLHSLKVLYIFQPILQN